MENLEKEMTRKEKLITTVDNIEYIINKVYESRDYFLITSLMAIDTACGKDATHYNYYDTETLYRVMSFLRHDEEINDTKEPSIHVDDNLLNTIYEIIKSVYDIYKEKENKDI